MLGLPLNIDGSEGPRCQAVRDFAAEMVNHPAIFGGDPWIALHDERFSTVSADNLVDGAVSKRKAKEKGITDMLAAQVILQDALETINKAEA
jgi:putative Holliday junction resolvase